MKTTLLAALGLLALIIAVFYSPNIRTVLGATPPLTVPQGGLGWGTIEAGKLIYGAGASALRIATTSTTTLTFSGPFNGFGSIGALVGGANTTVTWYGLSTTTAIAAPQVLYASSNRGVSSVATTTLTFSGPFNGFGSIGTLVGGSNTTVTWSGLSTTTAIAAPQLLYASSASGVSSVATTTLTASSPLSLSQAVVKVGGSNSVLSLDPTFSAYPFTPTSNYNTIMSATSTALWLRAGLAASTTARFETLNTSYATTSYASTTVLTAPTLYTTTLNISGTPTNALLYHTGTSVAPTSSQPLYIGSLFSTTTATSTFNLGWQVINALNVSTTTATSTFANGLQVTAGGLALRKLTSCDTIDTDPEGNLKCGSDNTGVGGGTYPFTPTAWNGFTTSATTTPIWAQAGLMASTTSYFDNATTSQLTITGKLYGDATTKIPTSAYFNFDPGFGLQSTPSADSPYLYLSDSSIDINFDSGGSRIILSGASDTSDLQLFSGAAGSVGITDPASGFTAFASTSLLSASRDFQFPNTSGTFCLTTTCAVFSYPFTPTAWGGQTTSATTSPLWLQGATISLMASSTSKFDSINTIYATSTFASTTAISASGELVAPLEKTASNSGELTVDTTTGQFRYGSAGSQKVHVPFYTVGLSMASSTWSIGTSTLYLGPAAAALTFTSVQCDTDTFLAVSLYDGTNRANYFIASSTIGTVALNTNNTFTSGETIRVDIGTTTAPTTGMKRIGCRFKFTYDAD